MNKFIEELADTVDFKTKVFNVIRWIFLLPGAIVFSIIASWFVEMLNSFSLALTPGVSVDSFFSEVYMESISAFILGASFILAGTYIAPLQKRLVSFSLMLIGLLFSGFLIAINIIYAGLWEVFYSTLLPIGVVAGFVTVYDEPELFYK